MSHGHHKTVCRECGLVMGQCRCPAADKTINYDTCNKCKIELEFGPKKTSLDPKQQLREALAREVYLKAKINMLEQQIKLLENKNAK